MEEIEKFTIDFVNSQKYGDISDIIRYLSKQNIILDNTINELKEMVKEILRKYEDIILSEGTGKFQVKGGTIQSKKINPFYSYKCLVFGCLEFDKTIDYSRFYPILKDKIGKMGNMRCNIPDNENNFVHGYLDTNFFQINFTFDQRDYSLKGIMKKEISVKDSLFDFLVNLPNGMKKEFGSYLPLNWGIYQFYIIFSNFIKHNYKTCDLIIEDIEYSH